MMKHVLYAYTYGSNVTKVTLYHETRPILFEKKTGIKPYHEGYAYNFSKGNRTRSSTSSKLYIYTHN